MAEAVSTTSGNGAAEKRIQEHAQKTLSLSAAQTELTALSADPLLPGVQQFFVRDKNQSHGKEYTYFIFNNELYCSGVSEDFGRFLKDFNFLKKTDLDEKWFLNALYKLKNFQDQLPIDRERIAQPNERLKPLVNKVSVPKLDRTDGAATFVFYTQMMRAAAIQKFVVSIASDYTVKIDRSFVE